MRRAITLDPRLALAHSNLGLALQQLGRDGEAVDAFAEAVRLAPDTIEFHVRLIRARLIEPGDPGLAALERLSAAIGADQVQDRIARHFALAKACDDLGQYRRAATHMSARLPGPMPPPERITDKMPGNFLYLGAINLALPNARIVHLRRDARDTCLSLYSHLFPSGHGYSYDLADLGRYYRLYEALMAHWRAVLPPGTMLDVQYEDLVTDFETQARRIVAHCRLDWDDACRSFHDARRPVRTASLSQVRRPLYTSSIGRWRHYRDMLRPLFTALEISE